MPCSKPATLAFAALLLGAAPAPPTAPATDAVALLRSSLDAPRTVSYVGQFETVRFSSNRALATIVKIEHRAPALTRRWYVAPESLYGDYTITRGRATYQFDTKRSKLTISHNPTIDNQIAASGSFDRVLQNYRAIVASDESVADRPTQSIVLINKYTGERTLRVWLDRQTHLVLKKEEYHANGSIASQTRFDELRYTSSIPSAIFSTDTPAGYAQIAGQDIAMPSSDIERVIKSAGFKPFEPKNLPQGFAIVGGDVNVVNGVQTLHLLYSDGLRSVSMFENATGAAADFGSMRPKALNIESGVDAQYVEDGPTTLLTWREKGLYFALVGDLMRTELVAIARSVA
jgi:negative regulator of sigma E activity